MTTPNTNTTQKNPIAEVRAAASASGRGADEPDLSGFEMDEDIDDGMEDVINVSDYPAKFNIGERRIVLKPRQSTRIERAYTVRIKGEGQSGDDLDPVVMRLTGKRVVPAWHKTAVGHAKHKPVKKKPEDD